MDVVYANQSITFTRGDFAGVTIRAGESYPEDDPIVAAYPDYFLSGDPRPSRSTETVSGYVEDATARPGAKRNTRRA